MRAFTFPLLGIALTSLLFTSACSSDAGNNNNTAKANISTENYKDLAIAATESIKEISSLDKNQAAGFSGFLGLFSKASENADASVFAKITRQVQQATLDCEVAGTFTAPDSFLLGNPTGSTLNNITFTMNNCNNGEGSISGTFTFSGNLTTTFTIEASNATIPSAGLSNFNGTVTCVQGSPEPDCSFDEIASTNNFSGALDNRTYSVSNINFSGDATNGFNVSATVTDPDHGNIDFSATGVIFDCNGVQPSTGNITITGADNATAIVTFDGCTEFTVSFNGASDTFSWDAI